MGLVGFFSYVHEDDSAEQGRIRRLFDDIVNEYQILTSDTVEVFIDKNEINWGDKWKDKIYQYINKAIFFIPILTPRYFNSPSCRSELQQFMEIAKQQGIYKIILPILYVDVEELHNENPQDSLIAEVANIQWEDWRDIRFAETSSEKYRRHIHQLAKRIISINQEIDKKSQPTSTIENINEDETNENTDGIIDVLADTESMLNELPEVIYRLTDNIKLLGNEFKEYQSAIEKSSSFKQAQLYARKMRHKLTKPSDDFLADSQIFRDKVAKINHGMVILLNRENIEKGMKESILSLYDNARDMGNALEILSNGLMDVEQLSRDMKYVSRKYRRGIAMIREAEQIIKQWRNSVAHKN